LKYFNKYYKVLGIKPGVGEDDIKRAYRKMAKLYHPDRSGDGNTREKFIQVNEAYEVLMRKDQYVREAISRYKKKNGEAEPAKPHRDPRYRPQTEQTFRDNPRQRAEAYADMRFREFEKTPIYKTAVAFNSFFNYLLVIIGALMVLSPFIEYYKLTPEAEVIEPRGFQFLPLVLGIAFLIGVRFFIFKNEKQ
jgi:curved DNA-binding protein CbpA